MTGVSRRAPNVWLATFLLALFVAGNVFVFHGALGHWVAGAASHVLTPVTGRVAWFATVFRMVAQGTDGAVERLQLADERQALDARTAELDQLKQDLAFYRTVAGIRERISGTPIAAGAFSMPRQGGVREVVVNRGAQDGVAVGDVVTTAEGSFVGVVRDAYDDHAVVQSLGDANLEVTARIAGTEVSGLVRPPAQGEGNVGEVVLALVQKEETVTEGQLIVTSGNDRFPPALVIGSVRSVERDATTLFATVHIAPAVVQPYAGPVLIVTHTP